MDYNDAAMAEDSPEVVDYAAFQHPPSPLFRDYLSGTGRVGPFYEGVGWDTEALLAACHRTLGLSRDREALSTALTRQQNERGAPEAATLAARLAHPEATAVVTGQQAGLFGGPLYVLYKGLAAIKVAQTLEKTSRGPVVPVFWVASDDHDFAEIRSASFLDEQGQIRTLRYAPLEEPVGKPASEIVLDDTIGALLDELARVLPPGLHRDQVLEVLTSCYRPGVSISGAFARLVSAFLPGLVVLDVSDPAIKELMVPVIRREILEASPTSRLASQAGDALLAAGYHQQVPVRPGLLNLFVVMQGERRAVATQDEIVEVRGLGKRMSLEEAARLAEENPAAWSPGVLLRPLAQDLILPTAAYVGGPAELAYHAQVGPSYAHFGIPRPVLFPRPSFTLIEKAQARALEAEGLQLEDLQIDPETLLARWTREAYPEVEETFARARRAVEVEIEAVGRCLGELDPTLRGAADGAQGRALHQIDRLHEKAMRALKKRDQSRASRLRRARDALLPGGSLQERGLGFVGLLARHGTGLIEEIRERMDPWARGHQVLRL
jgi:bacillithiol biosynthesis cysteine-adding enzyme BshC